MKKSMRRTLGMFSMLCLLCMLILGPCVKTEEPSEENLTPTGYPSGELQQKQVMYNGQIYYYGATGFDEPLPDGFEHVGAIEKVDNVHEPEEDFCGARVEVDQEVYANAEHADTIYLKYEKGYAKFEIR